jgi:hypothetical protein
VKTHRPLPEASVQFRGLVIEALWDHERFGYIDADAFVGTCPVCGAAVGVRFHGHAPRADLNCHGGCREDEIAARLGLKVRP